jgi:hypothetical protein
MIYRGIDAPHGADQRAAVIRKVDGVVYTITYVTGEVPSWEVGQGASGSNGLVFEAYPSDDEIRAAQTEGEFPKPEYSEICERCGRGTNDYHTHPELGLLCNDDDRSDACWDERLRVTA